MTLTLAPDVKEVPGPTPWLPGGNFLAFRRIQDLLCEDGAGPR